VNSLPTQTFINLNESKKNLIFNALLKEAINSNFETFKISSVVKSASIPRGSFYSYFIDKYDVYHYLLDRIASEKLAYFGPINLDAHSTFIDVFKDLYAKGLHFAAEHPKYTKLFSKILNDKQEIYEVFLKDGLELTRSFFKSFIIEDIQNGHISKNIDPEILADLAVNLTSNVSINEMKKEAFDLDRIESQIKVVIDILEKGIQDA
jgi:AcrR family transcriptional regulator